MSLSNFYSVVPELVKDFLQTHPLLYPVPMVTLTTRDLPDQFNHALSGVLQGPTGKSGISLIITATAAGEPSENIPAMFNLANALELTAFDFPMVNQDRDRDDSLRVPGTDLIASCIASLKKFKTGETEFAGLNFYEGKPPMDFPEVRPDEGLVIYRGRLLFAGGVEDQTDVVATPVITIVTEVYVGGSSTRETTITTSTPSAFILYTTDGSRPQWFGDGNANNNGTLYAGAFDASAFLTIRARAFLGGWRASLLATATVQVALLEESGEELLSETDQPLKSE